MDFGGDLSVLEASIIIQMINMSRLTGLLKLITINNIARLYFGDGELIYATIETRKKKIGRFLIERELITEEQLEEALRRYKSEKSNRKIGHILIDSGFLDRDSLVSAIQDQMKDVVFEVLQWKQGQFTFFVNEMPETEDILMEVKLDRLILEGLKKLDEAGTG